MGIRPQVHGDEIFRVQPIETDGTHPVPVSNFLNAQCKNVVNCIAAAHMLMLFDRLLSDRHRYPSARVQGRA